MLIKYNFKNENGYSILFDLDSTRLFYDIGTLDHY